MDAACAPFIVEIASGPSPSQRKWFRGPCVTRIGTGTLIAITSLSLWYGPNVLDSNLTTFHSYINNDLCTYFQSLQVISSTSYYSHHGGHGRCNWFYLSFEPASRRLTPASEKQCVQLPGAGPSDLKNGSFSSQYKSVIFTKSISYLAGDKINSSIKYLWSSILLSSGCRVLTIKHCIRAQRQQVVARDNHVIIMCSVEDHRWIAH